MNYILILFFLTPGTWPVQGHISSTQHGPFRDLLACEHAGKQAELISLEIGAQKVGYFCAATRHTDIKVRE